MPWYRKPAALIGFGALIALLIALIVWLSVEPDVGFVGSTETTSSTTTATTTSGSAPDVAPTQTVTETTSPPPRPHGDDGAATDHHDDDRAERQHVDQYVVSTSTSTVTVSPPSSNPQVPQIPQIPQIPMPGVRPALRAASRVRAAQRLTCLGRSAAARGVLGDHRLGAAHRGPARPGGERVVERMVGPAPPSLRGGERRPRPVVRSVGLQAEPAGRVGARPADDAAQRGHLVVVQCRWPRTQLAQQPQLLEGVGVGEQRIDVGDDVGRRIDRVGLDEPAQRQQRGVRLEQIGALRELLVDDVAQRDQPAALEQFVGQRRPSR